MDLECITLGTAGILGDGTILGTAGDGGLWVLCMLGMIPSFRLGDIQASDGDTLIRAGAMADLTDGAMVMDFMATASMVVASATLGTMALLTISK